MELIKDYDSIIYKACPCYAECLGAAARLVPDSAQKIISLGTGTGNLEKEVLARLGTVQMVGYDYERSYLKIARQKLGARFVGNVSDITQVVFPSSDAVVSSLTIHHLEDESKGRLFRSIYDSLNDGGRFVNFDIIKGKDNEEHSAFVDYILGFMKKNRLPDYFIAEERNVLNGVGEDSDKPMALEKQKELLERLGFTFSVDFRDKLFVVYHCDKAGQRV